MDKNYIDSLEAKLSKTSLFGMVVNGLGSNLICTITTTVLPRTTTILPTLCRSSCITTRLMNVVPTQLPKFCYLEGSFHEKNNNIMVKFINDSDVPVTIDEGFVIFQIHSQM